MKNLIFIILLFSSCSENEKYESLLVVNQSDSVLLESKKLHDSVRKKLKIVDNMTQEKVSDVIKRVNVLNNQLNNLKYNKTMVIHDTIYITEKKNFWGKSKTIIDSSKQSTIIDSSLNEH